MQVTGRVFAFAAALLSAGLFLSLPARANLVQNGDFEAGTFADWTVTGDVFEVSLPYFGLGSVGQDGNWEAAFNAGDSPPNATLSQSFATTIGQNYTLTFDYGSQGAPQQIAAEILDPSSAIVAQTIAFGNGIGSPLGSNTLAFTADASTMTVEFLDFPGNPTISTDGALDNVSVTADEAVAEPASLILMGAGLGALGWARRRRKA